MGKGCVFLKMPHRDICSVFPVPDRDFLSVKGRERAELVFSVPVQVHQHRVADRAVQQLFFLPAPLRRLRRCQAPDPLVRRDQARRNAVPVAAGIAVVAVQAFLQDMQFQGMLFVKAAQILRKDRRIDLSRIAPVALRMVLSGFDRAHDEPVHPAPGEDVEAVDMRDVGQGVHLPVALSLRRYHHQLCLQRLVRRIEPGRGQKLSVRTRNLNHGHDAARFGPERILQRSVLVEEIAGVRLLRRHEELPLSLVEKRCDGIALVQLCQNFFPDFHKLSFPFRVLSLRSAGPAAP